MKALFFIVCAAACTRNEPGTSFGHRADYRAILDEVAAGYQENQSLIQGGSATYTVVKNRPQEGRIEKSTQTITFLGPNIRVDTVINERLVRVETTTPERHADFFGDDLRGGDAQSVIISPSKQIASYDIHPRMSGSCTISDFAAVIQKVRNDPDCVVEATREGELYLISYTAPSRNVRERYWVAPAQGYSILRHRKETLSIPDEPYRERESSFTRLPNGAFVIENSRLLTKYTTDRKVYTLGQEVSVVLEAISLNASVSLDVFELEGMGLPKGIPVIDRITGHDLVWGEDIVRESDIPDRLPVGGARPSTNRMLVALVGTALIVVLLVLHLWHARKRSREDNT